MMGDSCTPVTNDAVSQRIQQLQEEIRSTADEIKATQNSEVIRDKAFLLRDKVSEFNTLKSRRIKQQFAALTADLDAARADLAEERQRNAPLRQRIHEIQEHADKRIAPLQSEVDYFKRLWASAFDFRVVHEGDDERISYERLVALSSPEFAKGIVRYPMSANDKARISMCLARIENAESERDAARREIGRLDSRVVNLRGLVELAVSALRQARFTEMADNLRSELRQDVATAAQPASEAIVQRGEPLHYDGALTRDLDEPASEAAPVECKPAKSPEFGCEWQEKHHELLRAYLDLHNARPAQDDE